MRFGLLFIIVIAVGVAFPAMAQHNDVFTSYGVDDGLPQSTVWSIAQDKNGFLWVGTSDGVCRFDGYNFTVYRNNSNDSSTIVGGLYYRFYVDSKRELWTVSQNGISMYDAEKDKFKQVFCYKINAPTDHYNCILGEDEHSIWAYIASYGLLQIDKSTQKVVVANVSGKGSIPMFDNFSWQSGVVSDGKIWISGSTAACYVYDVATGASSKANVSSVYKMVVFNDSEILAAAKNELVLLNKKDGSCRKISAGFKDEVVVSVTDIFVSSATEVILSCAKGLYFVDPRTWKITRHLQCFNPDRRHSYEYVQCLFKDKSGNLWIGTNGDGLKKMTAPNKKFKYYTSNNDTSNVVKAIYADSRHVYAGYFGNGLDIFDRQRGLEKHFSLNYISPALNHVFGIAPIDSTHMLLHVATYGNIFNYNPVTDKCQLFSPLLERLIPNYKDKGSFPFFCKSATTIYTGVAEHLVALDVSNPDNIRASVAYIFKGATLTTAFVDSRRRIWVGAMKGGYCLENGRSEKMPLPEALMVKSINEDPQGNVWVGTIKGVYVLDSNKKILQYYSEYNGLSNQFIYGILKDNNGNMWLSHNKGLSEFNTRKKSFRHFYKEDGLQSNEFNTGASFKAADGELFFGGINGVNSFYPEEITDNPHVPDARITMVKLFDMPMPTDTAYWDIHNLVLPYTQNSLSFEFAANEFTNPSKNQYAYMMEALDNNWIKSGDKRFARYAALPPGKYVFKVKACNNDGLWQVRPTTINITIVPPFWQRLPFRIFSVLLLLGILTGILLSIQRQRHKRHIRALELQQKIQLERERISRDLHDNVGTQLSLISNNIEWVTHPLKPISELEKAEKLQFVNNSAREIIATLRETIWALNKQEISLEEFCDKFKAFIQKQLTIYPQIDLKFTEDIADTVLLGPSEALNLFRICQEAVANALKYANASAVDIAVKTEQGVYTVTIADNGIGFDMTKVDPSRQNGLENMKHRTMDIDCGLVIHTRLGAGTRIVVRKNKADAVL